jgi:predicted PurR-regulated permease PerM
MGLQPVTTTGRGLGIRLPWDSILTWAGTLLVLYALHGVFPIVFLTFLLVYLVRAVVVPLACRISPGEERPGLERWLTLGTFGVVVVLLWALGSFLGPRLVLQGRLLVAHVEHLEPQEVLDHLLARTVGAYLFARTFGGPEDPRYRAAFARFAAQGRAGEGAFAGFGPLQARVQAGFEMAYEAAARARLKRQIKGKGAESTAFERWFLEFKAPARVAKRRAVYVARLPAGNRSSPPENPGDLEHRLGELALRDLEAQPAERAKLVAEWEDAQTAAQWRELRASPEYIQAFQSWFESPRGQALKVPYDLKTYLALRDAYEQGAAPFNRVFQERVSRTPAGRRLSRLDFQRATELNLARQWWAASPAAASLREHLQQDASEVAGAAAGRVAAAIRALIALPAQVGTALLLTILISFDMGGLKRGARRLPESRLAGLYAKAAPNLVAVGRLIGRSFAAQGVIAVFNTLLSVALMRLLDLGNEVLLGAVVFIASFIPVLGIVFSGIPIALQALLQPDGSLALALYALLGIGGIHAIESMVLSPRIVGKFLHLHPVLVLSVLVVGEHLFGVWGLLLGVPLAVYAIHAGVLAEPIPGVYEPGPAPEPAAVVK